MIRKDEVTRKEEGTPEESVNEQDNQGQVVSPTYRRGRIPKNKKRRLPAR